MPNSKKHYLLTIVFTTFVSLLAAQQFARTADRSNFTAIKTISAQPTVKWKYQTGGKVFSSPVVAGDIVITGSCDSTLYALNKHTGTLIWKFKTGGEIRSTVAIANKLVFFFCTDGFFYALDLLTGNRKWQFGTSGEKFYDTWDYFQSSPAVSKGVVYFGAGDGYVYALKAEDGAPVWKFKTDGIVHAAPLVTDNAVLIGSFDGFFYCFNIDGSLRWKFNTVGERFFTKGEVQFNAVVSDSTVYFCARDYNLYALNIKTGSGHWMYHQPGSWTSVPSLSGSTLVVTMSDSHNILGFDKNNGAKVMDTPVPLNVFSSASINDSIAYFGCLNGMLYQCNLKSGRVSAIFQTASSRKNYGRFFDNSGKVDSGLPDKYNGDFNAVYNDFLQLGSILSTVWIDDGVLYFGSTDGWIYAIS